MKNNKQYTKTVHEILKWLHGIRNSRKNTLFFETSGAYVQPQLPTKAPGPYSDRIKQIFPVSTEHCPDIILHLE
jgi:hypothetical protein